MANFSRYFRKRDIVNLLRRIFEGSITPQTMNGTEAEKLFEATFKVLNSGVKIAFTDKLDKKLLRELQDNIYIFSGAKTYTQVKDISSLITDNGKLRSFTEFRKLAKAKFDTYNVDYLSSEYETAVGQAQSAVKWQQIEREAKLFPYLQRKAVMDANTSPECRILNEIIAPVGDPIWRTRSPLTHFRCRCILTQIDKYEDVKLSSQSKKDAAVEKSKNINPLFKGNAGIDKVIFNDSHPYFDIEPRDKGLAKRNFNL